jgi:DNA/RNA-binding domain of Phe-tRNA-synthetase-like protein
MSDTPRLSIENRLAGRVAVGWFVMTGATIEQESGPLSLAIEARVRTLQEAYPEPALAGRAIQGKGLYRVNTAVDAANLASLSSFLPVGLYDRDRIEGNVVVLRLGSEGESYPGIGKGDIHLDGRPLLADERGPFGNPSADSLRTSVGIETRSLLFVLYAPAQTDRGELDRHLDEAARIMQEYTGARRV